MHACVFSTFNPRGDASDFTVGAVLGQRKISTSSVVYYASKTMNDAQRNYTTTEKEMLAIVFALEKFCPYLLGGTTTVFTDHSALKHLLSKKEAKQRLIRWVLLLQEFKLEFKDKKGVENVVADHLSRIKCGPLHVRDEFPDEHLFSMSTAPWYADIVNYLVFDILPDQWNKSERERFLAEVHRFIWDEPYLFKACPDDIIRRCIPDSEIGRAHV